LKIYRAKKLLLKLSGAVFSFLFTLILKLAHSLPNPYWKMAKKASSENV
jgi:hypothetical protein